MANPHANAWFSRDAQRDFLVWHAYCYSLFSDDVADILEAVPAKSYDSGLSRISSSSARIRGAR